MKLGHVIVPLIPAWLLAVSVFAAPDSVRVSVEGTPAAGGMVSVAAYDGARYIALNDLVRLFSLRMYYNATTKKMEVKLTRAYIRVAANNAFVVVTDYATRKQSIEQFSLPVRNVGDLLYVPADDFVPLFNSVSKSQIALEIPAPGKEPAPGELVEIRGVDFESRMNGYFFRIHAAGKLKQIDRFVRNDVWLYITIPDARADTARLNATPRSAVIERVIAVQSATSLQLAFMLRQRIESSEIVQDPASNDILVTLQTASTVPTSMTIATMGKEPDSTAVSSVPVSKVGPAETGGTKENVAVVPERTPPSLTEEVEKPTPRKEEPKQVNEEPAKRVVEPVEVPKTIELKKEEPPPSANVADRLHPTPKKSVKAPGASEQAKLEAQLKRQRTRWKLDVVVVDAGHGGKDPGSLGTIGTREKDVTLGIALKLGKLIETKMPSVRVVYTRKTDRFIELYRRGQIANENEGKLFISIHCNSMEHKPSPARGFAIYLLRPGKTEDAIHIAETENAVVKLEQDYQDRYQQITQENFIILTMAQSAYFHNSERFAEFLQEEMEKHLVPEGQAVKQAGFYVLVGASMPNVLIETGYLSNRREEMFLRSPKGQQTISESIFRALQRYKISYEKTLAEGN